MRFSDGETSSESDRNYEVGYGKPPKHSRFQPGHSGSLRGKPAGALHPAAILKRTLLEEIGIKHPGRETSTTKVKALSALIINQAMRGVYPSVLLLFRYAGLGLKLSEATREQDGGIPPEAGDLIRRALLGENVEAETLSIDKLSCEPSSPSEHVNAPLQLNQVLTAKRNAWGTAIRPSTRGFRKVVPEIRQDAPGFPRTL
jgi:uncharacterized protein DUF5681